jgi:uncharacterized protein
MHPSIEKLLKVQEVDSQLIFLRESMRMRPRELEDDRRKAAETKAGLEAVEAQIKRAKVDSDQRELDVGKADAEITKIQTAMNQSKSNQEYTIFKEQIKRQEEIRGKAEEDVIGKLHEIDALDLKRKEWAARLAEAEKTFRKKEAEVTELVRAMQKEYDSLQSRRGGLLEGIDPENLKVYERVLERHNNFAIARVEGQICHGCYMSVTSQEINLLLQGSFLQCKNCSRILCLG